MANTITHPGIAILDQDAIDAAESGTTAATEFTTRERTAVLEIANHLAVERVEVLGRDDEGILVVMRTDVVRYDRPASMREMPYTFMWVDKRGHVAPAMTNHPVYHRSFRECVEDLNPRTAR